MTANTAMAAPPSGNDKAMIEAKTENAERNFRLARIEWRAKRAGRPPLPPHHDAGNADGDDREAEQHIGNDVPKPGLSLVQRNADRHRLAEHGIVLIGGFGENLAGVLVDMNGAVTERIGRIIAHRIAAQRPDTCIIGRNGNLETGIKPYGTAKGDNRSPD